MSKRLRGARARSRDGAREERSAGAYSCVRRRRAARAPPVAPGSRAAARDEPARRRPGSCAAAVRRAAAPSGGSVPGDRDRRRLHDEPQPLPVGSTLDAHDAAVVSSPNRIFSASGFFTSFWMSRAIGRAPIFRSKPCSASHAPALGRELDRHLLLRELRRELLHELVDDACG